MSDIESVRDRESFKNKNMGADRTSGVWNRGESPTKNIMSQTEIKEELQKRRDKNEANLRLTNFKKSFTRPNGSEIPTLQEKIQFLPTFFKPDDW